MPVLTSPLQFEPLVKRLRWGGRRLGTVLQKPIGEGSDYAESWELCDHGADQSLVARGPLAGWALQRLVAECNRSLFGRHAGLKQFPLLCKFLDAADRLSVQVHPNDTQARVRDPQERGKTEAWVILDAMPGSVVYAGLKAGVSRLHLMEAIAAGTVEACLHRVPVAVGDCLFIPAGAVHAIGEGILLAEVQQSSDITYRLFDWNRVGADGQPRALHIAESLACIDFDLGPVAPVVPETLSQSNGAKTEELVRCPYFTIRRKIVEAPVAFPADDRCHVLMLLEGALRMEEAGPPLVAERGETVLLPAGSLPQTVTPVRRSVFLDVFWE